MITSENNDKDENEFSRPKTILTCCLAVMAVLVFSADHVRACSWYLNRYEYSINSHRETHFASGFWNGIMILR